MVYCKKTVRTRTLMYYCAKLRELREDRDKSQEEISKLLGTSQSYYAKYENGVRPLPTRHLITLCQYYGVSADYILGLPRGLNWPR